ncbi:hypothetical protein [Alkalibacillus salilacus]|uniref:Clp R domain-containing protein n=1 Tax=Alkalibacillus salilacus TaxID=284582 RepID=A0ABT9VD68_9BACI|nr:hypothetical protein [Alkalibacillus salilacus]MDQ0158923.1 hypothetical protein [Alkalibacillus salilacus]
MKFTERTLRVLKNAEKEAERANKIVYPVHLLLGILLERTSVCAELNISYPKLWNTLNERVNKIYFDKAENGINYKPFKINISLSTEQVLEIANNRKERFNQIF